MRNKVARFAIAFGSLAAAASAVAAGAKSFEPWALVYIANFF